MRERHRVTELRWKDFYWGKVNVKRGDEREKPAPGDMSGKEKREAERE